MKKLEVANAVASRVDENTFLGDMALLQNLTQALEDRGALMCSLLSCDNSLGTSVMMQVQQALEIFNTFLQSDFVAVHKDIFNPYKRAISQTSVVKERYDVYRTDFKERAMFILESVATDSKNFTDFYEEDLFDVHLASRQYFKAFHRYRDITLLIENIAVTESEFLPYITRKVELPVTLYNGSEEREAYLEHMNTSLNLLRNITDYMSPGSKLYGTPFRYDELTQVTEIDDDYFGSYFACAHQECENMLVRNIDHYFDMFANLSDKFFTSSVRELVAPITQLSDDIELYSNRFMDNRLSKLQVMYLTI